MGIAACATTLLLGLSAPSAHGAATIGQLDSATPPTGNCVPGNTFELLQPAVAAGTSYVVPAGGAAITSWSTNAAAGAGQLLKLKVWRKVGDPATYQAVAQDGPRPLAAGTLNTFPVNIPTQPGDVIGLTYLNSAAVACTFASAGNTTLTTATLEDATVGQQAAFETDELNRRLNLSAVVALKASNDFDFAKVKKNKNKGTAVLSVDVPGPGTLSLTGTGLKAQRTGGATISKQVTEAGTVKLKVKAKGAKKQKLLSTGKVKVKAKVTFKPSATGGDVAGDPSTETKKIKLVDNG